MNRWPPRRFCSDVQDSVAAKLDAAPYDNEELTDEALRVVKEASDSCIPA